MIAQPATVASDSDALSKLPALFPQGKCPTPPATPSGALPRQAEVLEAFAKATGRRPRRSAPDIYGWRYEYLAILDDHPELTKNLAALVCRAITGASGQGPLEALLRSRLVPFSKDGGGVRPIAIGTILRRLVTRAFCTIFGKDITEAVGSEQYALQANGGELMHKTVFGHMAMHPDHVMVSLDISNAFGTLQRDVALQAAGTIPGLSEWVHAMLACSPTHTFLDGLGRTHNYKMTRGLDQGCPWSAQGFPLTLKRAIAKACQQINTAEKQALLALFQDDIIVCCKLAEVPNVLAIFRVALRELGLEVNQSKCSLAGADLQAGTVVHGMTVTATPTVLKAHRWPAPLTQEGGCQAGEFLSDSSERFGKLGQCRTAAGKRLRELVLAGLPLQQAFYLWRLLVNTDSTWMMRTASIPKFAAQRLDDITASGVEHILGLDPLPLVSRRLLFISMREGGLGL